MKPLIATTKVLYQISLGVLFLILCIVSSCNKDEDSPQASELIIGTWTVESVTIDFLFDNKTLVQYLVDEFQILESEAEMLVELLSDSYSEFFTGTITINSNNTYQLDFGDGVESGTWEMSSDGKTITFDKNTSDETVATIVTLNSSTLIIEMTQNAEEDLDEDGVDENLDMEIIMTLKK